MSKLHWESDAASHTLDSLRVAVLGYGSQGRGQALNLRDSGADVVLGLRENGPTWKQAQDDGWNPCPPSKAVKNADIVCMLVPDMAQPDLFEEAVAPNLKDGAALLFSHGFNIHYQQIKPPANIDVIMVAPKGPGGLVRREFERGCGVPCLLAVHQNTTGRAQDIALAYAHAIGGTRSGVIETSFSEETETDLFGEQAVLCGGATQLIVTGWETLVEAGYSPEVAYFECLHELKLIVDLIYEGGLARMHKFVSDTAKYGDLTRGPMVIDSHTRDRMREILKQIQDGTFAREWTNEHKSGNGNYHKLLADDISHPIERIGADLRARFQWLNHAQGTST